MRFQEFKNIIEASGVFNRQAGQMFRHPDTNHELEFVKIVAYPSDAEQFDDVAARDAAIEQLNQSLDIDIEWTNNPTSGMLAFGLAYLKEPLDSSGKESTHIFARYFKKMSQAGLPANWNSKDFHGYRLQTGAASKLQQGLMPQDILGLEEKRYRGIDNLMNAVRANLKDKPEVLEGFETVARGELPATFPGQRNIGTAIRDYAGEVLQPIAIMSGANVGQGVKAAKQDLIPNQEWSEMDLFWPSGKNHALVDSVFVRDDGLEIGISSKGKQGADASMKNIQDAIKKAKTTSPGLLSTHADVVDIVNIIDQNSAEEGPLLVAEEIKLLTAETTEFIRKMKTTAMTVEDIQKEHNKNPQILQVYQSFGAKINHQNYNIYFHMVTNVAKMVAQKLNSTAGFGEGMMAFMKQASIIQVYTQIGNSGDDVSVTEFRSVYPPQFEGVILVNGGKNYASTKIFGKLAFKMPH